MGILCFKTEIFLEDQTKIRDTNVLLPRPSHFPSTTETTTTSDEHVSSGREGQHSVLGSHPRVVPPSVEGWFVRRKWSPLIVQGHESTPNSDRLLYWQNGRETFTPTSTID